MFKPFVFAITLMAAAAPNLKDIPMVQQMPAQCEDGSTMVVTQYADKSLVFSRETGDVVYFNPSNRTGYVYGEKKYYTADELVAKYPTPCDVPFGTGT